MKNNISQPPIPNCEPVKAYAPGSKERLDIMQEYQKGMSKITEIPMLINGKNVKSKKTRNISPPHNHKHIVGKYYEGNSEHINNAIKAALNAQSDWEETCWEERSAIFLKAAELLAGPYRQKINAATMIGQSKNVFQAEIDAACELIDFLRYNVYYMQEIYEKQPESDSKVWNRLTYRPLEGFVYAISPFNFTAIAGNLCASAAMMGNVVVWKPSDYQIYSAKVIIKVFEEAGFIWRDPGCSMCLGMNPDQLKPYERCASTSNRNFEGRQGYLGRTHLMSPLMAAYTAINGTVGEPS